MATDPFDFGDTVEDFEVETDDSSAPADNNRTFMMVAGGMGLLVMLTLICFAAYAFFFAPRQKAAFLMMWHNPKNYGPAIRLPFCSTKRGEHRRPFPSERRDRRNTTGGPC